MFAQTFLSINMSVKSQIRINQDRLTMCTTTPSCARANDVDIVHGMDQGDAI